MEKMFDIDLSEYNYHLPEERIAQFPVNVRDTSKLLLYDKGEISSDVFRNIDDHIPSGSLLVFNNTRVIRARLLFRKESGANIEVFCLEPVGPADYGESFASLKPVEWKCIIGNLKKWKTGTIITSFAFRGRPVALHAEKIRPEGEEAWRIRLSWDCNELSFGEVIELAGHIPLPPYINRGDRLEDAVAYQTVYSSISGSVAAPTAGLHFTAGVLDKLAQKGVNKTEVTLHVGAGTFKPVKSGNITDHEMHCEHFFITRENIASLMNNYGRIIAVGTTSVRTIESLYWMGVKILKGENKTENCFTVGQWEPYDQTMDISPDQSLKALLSAMDERGIGYLHGSTSIIIVPGYDFKMTGGLITNFHQPGSTLLLLVSAWVGNGWKKIYSYAMENDFRFLSYGDSSLLYR